MLDFLGLSLVSWQTILIIAFPFLYRQLPKFIGLCRRLFLKDAYEQIPSCSGLSPPTEPPPSLRARIGSIVFRSHTAMLVFCYSIFIGQILFTSPSRSNPFTITQLNLATPSATLTSTLAKVYRTKLGLKEIPVEQQRLLQRLTTLDSRYLYATLGPDSLLNCHWCRPISSKQDPTDSGAVDHLLYTIPRMSIQYVLFIFLLGLMTTRAKSLDRKRRTWRSRLGMIAIVVLSFEIMFFSAVVHVPSLMSTMDSGRMLWDIMYIFRRIIFTFLITVAWWSVITEPDESALSVVTKLGLALATISVELDTLVNRLRLAALQRSTLLRDLHYRTETNEFWTNAEHQSKTAQKDPSIIELKNQMGLSESNSENRDQLKQWIDLVYPDPDPEQSRSS